MNEEIKKPQEELRNQVKQWVKNDDKGYEYWDSEHMDFVLGRGLRLIEEAYLQGAKDMWEAVKLKKENRITRLTQLDTGDVSDGAVGYEVGYENARYKMNKQAQQFIDSLEKGKKTNLQS